MVVAPDCTGPLDLTPLRRALASLEAALARPKDEFIRDSVIQRFEYTYELSWKLLKRHLEYDEGSAIVDQLSRKELYRVAGEKGLLQDVGAWLTFHRARNETSHAYNESKADEVYAVAGTFAMSARLLLHELERRNHD